MRTIPEGGIIVPDAHARFERQKDDIERFMDKVDVMANTECWPWMSTLSPGGYAVFHFDGKPRRAHRWSYEQWVGPIPEGLQLDHLCSVRHCVNPWHMEPVTGAENIRRAAERQTHCVNGHPLSGENLALVRVCRTCRTATSARYDAKKKEQRQ